MSSGPVYRAVFGVAGVLLASRLLGFVREVVIADRFGTSADYDLYLIAIMFSALAYGILNYAGYYLFVPYLTRKLEAGGDDRAPADIWPLVNLSLIAAVVVIVFIVAVAPYLLRFWVTDYIGDQFDRIVFFSRITALAVLLGIGEAFMRALLNVRRIYTYPAGGYIVFNLFSIAAIVLFAGRLGVGAVALGWLGGLLVQNIYLGVKVARAQRFGGYSSRAVTPETKYLITTAGILIVIEMINRSYFLIDRYFAPQFGEGIVSALNYSQVLVQLPDSIIGFAIGAVVFPIFSAHAAPENRERFAALYEKTVAAAVLIAVPIAAFMFVNAQDLVFLLFQRGEFDPRSTAITATVLRPYLPAMIALFVVSTSIRACYSGGWVRAVFFAAVLVFVAKFLATSLLARYFGYGGISGGTSVAQVGFAMLLMVVVVARSKVPAGRFVGALLRILVAGVASTALAWYILSTMPVSPTENMYANVFVRFAVSGLTLLAAYLLLGYPLGLRARFADITRLRSTGGSADQSRAGESD